MGVVARKRLGEILVEMGALSDERLRAALSEQQRWGGRLGQILVQMRAVQEPALLAALSTQLSVPVAPLDTIQIPTDVAALVSRAVCEELGVLPFALRGSFLDLAMLDPSELDSIERVRVLSRKNVRPFLVGPQTFERALKRCFEAPAASATMPRGLPELDPMFGGDLIDPDPEPPPPPPARATAPLPPARPIEVDEPPPRPRRTTFVPPSAAPAPPPKLAPIAPLDLDDPPEPVRAPPLTDGYDLGALREGSASDPTPAWAAALSEQLAQARSEIAGLAGRVVHMEALISRDEAVLRKLLALLVAGGVCTQEQLMVALRTAQEG